MKKSQSLILIAFLVSAAFCAKAQTNTNSIPWYSGLQAIGNDVINATNVAVAPYASVLVTGAEKGKVGGGLLALYDINNYVGAGVGVDYLGQWSEFSGNIQIKLPIQPLTTFGLTNFTVTPFILAGIGTPIAGAGTANGGISAITSAGVNLDIYKFSDGWTISAGAAYGTRTGAGNYSGDMVNAFLALRRGF